MRSTLALGTVLLALALTQNSAAQDASPLVGTWERMGATNADGTPDTHPTALHIFTGNGYYSLIAIPPNRPKSRKPLQEMTREELLARFTDVQSRHGKYTVRGNELIRKDTSNINPNAEGAEQAVRFRIDGDTLILSSRDPSSQAEAKWKRVE